MSKFNRDWRTKFVTLTTAAAFTSMAMLAHAATPEESIKARQQHYKDIGAANKAINDTLKTDSPDVAILKKSAATLKKSADDMANWFPKGTGPESGVKTDAKAEVWSDSATFATKIKAFQEETGKLVPLAEAGNVEGVRTQMGKPGVGTTCGGCHETFRAKKT